MKNKILVSALFLAPFLGINDIYAMEGNVPDVVQHANNQYQLTPLLGISNNLDAIVLDAIHQMNNVPRGEYSFHTAGKCNGQVIFLETYDLMRNIGNCGFDSLALNRNTFADMFYEAFSETSWNSYSMQQKNDLSILLRNVIRYWVSQSEEVNNLLPVLEIEDAFEDILNGGLYLPEAFHEVLDLYIDTTVRINRPIRKADGSLESNIHAGSLVSDLHDSYISLISYITGIGIITSSEHGLLEPLALEINMNHNTERPNIILHNTEGHWLRAYTIGEITDYFQMLRRNRIPEGNALIRAVEYYRIPWLHFPDTWENVPDMFFDWNKSCVIVSYKPQQ